LIKSETTKNKFSPLTK